MRILLDSCCPANEDGGGGFLNTGHNLDCADFPIDALTKLGKWNKQEQRTDTKKIREIKDLFIEERKIDKSQKVDVIPILHNKGEIILQFCGWSINLLDDGTFYWEDTTG